MTSTVKIVKKRILLIIFMAVILLYPPVSAMNTAFIEYSIKNLKVIAVDAQAETVIFQSPDGQTATFTVGDFVGLEDYEIISIDKCRIKFEGPPDDSGRPTKDSISLIPIAGMDSNKAIRK